MKDFQTNTAPKEISETGLDTHFLIGLIAKIMNEGGTMVAAQIAGIVKLSPILVRQILNKMQELHLIEARGLESQDIKSDIRYALTDRGKKEAYEALLMSKYVGPAPVTLEAFWAQIKDQTIKHEVIHREELERGLSHLVLPDGMINQLGPAVNSGRSVLLYGEAGNGKTSIAEALGKVFSQQIFIPHAFIVGSQVIRFFDETLHDEVDEDEAEKRARDQRWVKIERPVVVTGGELTLDMLDLQFDEHSRLYEAPMHLKALGGVFVIDDFGRQRSSPTEILNRWIVPLESHFDIMSLHTGQKFRVPFDQLVMFSTNTLPEDLADDASLRRIHFKIFVPSPTREDYLHIFSNLAKVRGLDFDGAVLGRFFDSHYKKRNVVPSGAHPGFLIDHVKALAAFLGQPPELSEDFLDVAWKNVAVARRKRKITDLSL
ncbi:ATPase [Aliiroseovarius crassostreae]|uniref:ATPase n=1 Tax=Aliiroseovarius crassostreae TaxID=154981 RepID=UPI00220812B6|nr:ATPase [Aliiroseovarius crassostreae]UWQ05773.1 ATPase [Aliiroseovarius crassostreae]